MNSAPTTVASLIRCSCPVSRQVACLGLAALNGEVVLLDATANELIFFDPFRDMETRRLTPAVPLDGGLVGGGDRGTLFGINALSQIVEIDATDGSVINTIASPGLALVGLALVGGVLLVTDNTGTAYQIDPDTGAVNGTLAVPAGLSALGGDGGGGMKQFIGGDYQPLLDTILDDEASISITEGVGPYTGRFIPVEPLTTFDGTNSFGSWRLEVEDTALGNTGVINDWRLLFNEPQDTAPDASLIGFVGDNFDAGVGLANDVDVYQFELLVGGTITVDAVPDDGLNVAVRLFDSLGNELTSIDAGGTDGAEQLIFAVANGGTYYIGISSSANLGYDVLDGSGATGGTTTGSYRMDVRFSEPVPVDDDNSSFDTATQIGTLGMGGTLIRAEIRSAPFTGEMPGSIDEPGHRDIPPESHLLGGAGFDKVEGRIILGFNENVSPTRRAEILDQQGLELVKHFDFIGASVVKTRPGADTTAKLLELASLAGGSLRRPRLFARNAGHSQ